MKKKSMTVFNLLRDIPKAIFRFPFNPLITQDVWLSFFIKIAKSQEKLKSHHVLLTKCQKAGCTS